MWAVSEGYKYLLAALIAPFFWWALLGTILWLVRRFRPQWEATLFRKL